MSIPFPYMAGYIDGDGHFSIRKRFNKRGDPYIAGEISICSTKKEVLDEICSSFGGNIRTDRPKYSHWADQHIWQIRGQKALSLCNKINPFLKEKRLECDIFIKFMSQPFCKESEALVEKMKGLRKYRIEITEETIEHIRSFKEKVPATEEDYCYLAGYIDAECSVGISKFQHRERINPSYKIRVAGGTTCPIVPTWIMQRFGGSVSFRNTKNKAPLSRNKISLHINSTDSFKIIENVLPFIRTKRTVCEKVIEFKKTMLPRGYSRLAAFVESYPAILETREALIQIIHSLNSKGSDLKRVVISATSAVSSL